MQDAHSSLSTCAQHTSPDPHLDAGNYGLSLACPATFCLAHERSCDSPIATGHDDTDQENLASSSGLQGKYDEMKPSAPRTRRIVDQNVRTAREMVQPTRTWEALAERAEMGKLPASPASATGLDRTRARRPLPRSTPVRDDSPP